MYFEIFFRLNKSLHLLLFAKKAKVAMAYCVPSEWIPFQFKSLDLALLCPSFVITFSPMHLVLKEWIWNLVMQD